MTYYRAVKIVDAPKGYLCQISDNVWKHVNKYGELKNDDIVFNNSKILELINEKKVEIIHDIESLKFDVVNSIDSVWMDDC
jgi:hypothetical protein